MSKPTTPKEPSQTVRAAEAEARSTGKDKTEYGRVSRSKHVTDRKTVKANGFRRLARSRPRWRRGEHRLAADPMGRQSGARRVFGGRLLH